MRQQLPPCEIIYTIIRFNSTLNSSIIIHLNYHSNESITINNRQVFKSFFRDVISDIQYWEVHLWICQPWKINGTSLNVCPLFRIPPQTHWKVKPFFPIWKPFHSSCRNCFIHNTSLFSYLFITTVSIVMDTHFLCSPQSPVPFFYAIALWHRLAWTSLFRCWFIYFNLDIKISLWWMMHAGIFLLWNI